VQGRLLGRPEPVQQQGELPLRALEQRRAVPQPQVQPGQRVPPELPGQRVPPELPGLEQEVPHSQQRGM
jgi:hypothetical protein